MTRNNYLYESPIGQAFICGFS